MSEFYFCVDIPKTVIIAAYIEEGSLIGMARMGHHNDAKLCYLGGP